MKFRTKNNRNGFTLVETLVAISILVLALTGPLAIIAKSLKTSYFSRDEITAAYLAQEPIEYIRNLRDQNGLRWSNSSMWLKGISSNEGTATNYVNTGSAKDIRLNLVWRNGFYGFDTCNAPSQCRVKFDPDAGDVIYGSETGPYDSIFTREVYLSRPEHDPETEDTAPDRELLITVVVKWSSGGVEHNVTVTERIMNWQLENQS